MNIENVNLDESGIEKCNMDSFDLDKTIDNMVTPNLTVKTRKSSVKKSVVKKQAEKKDHVINRDYFKSGKHNSSEEFEKIYIRHFNDLLKKNGHVKPKIGAKITTTQLYQYNILQGDAYDSTVKEISNRIEKSKIQSKPKPKPKKVDKTGNGNLEPTDIGKKGSRAWCGTCNNYTQDDVDFYKNLFEKDKSIIYFIYGFEIGEKCKTPHLQMFIYFKNTKTFNVMCKKYCKVKPTQWRNMRTNQFDCSEYCKKDGKYFEFGEAPKKKGQRTDLEDVYKKIKEGATFSDIAEYAPGLAQRYANGIDRVIRELHNKPRTTAPQIRWLWGESGSGKTHSITSVLKPDEYYMKGNTKWWDGYQQQRVVIMDEYNGHMLTTELNMLLSHHQYLVEVKGGMVHFNSPLIYIISDSPPAEVYGDKCTGKQFLQLWRRIKDHVYYFSSDFQMVKDGYNSDHELLLNQSGVGTSKEYVDVVNSNSAHEAYKCIKDDMNPEYKDKYEENLSRLGEARYSKLEWEEPEDMTDDED